jgi:hypothetical protein
MKKYGKNARKQEKCPRFRIGLHGIMKNNQGDFSPLFGRHTAMKEKEWSYERES